ncbi:MAG: hypothetical protein RIR10_948 [Planctomycetota bacterium]|jgi:hypothetical protein
MRHWTNDAEFFAELLGRAAEAMRSSPYRQGCVVRLPRRGRILATGDLHDHAPNLAAILKLAELDASPRNALVLHELIHPDWCDDGIDRSYRMLGQVAELVCEYPWQVHPILANHEIAQLRRQPITKGAGDNVVAFDAGLEWGFGDDAEVAAEAVAEFIRAMPLAIRTDSGLMISHSLPSDAVMRRFDLRILERDLHDEDFDGPDGAAYLMTWGRNPSPALLARLAHEWGVQTFVVGHTHVPGSVEFRAPNLVILNSDTDDGKAIPIQLESDVAPAEKLVADAWSLKELHPRVPANDA